MPCEFGQILQDEFDKAVAARQKMETGPVELGLLQDAKVKESGALQLRSFHIRDCHECWVSPPRLRRMVATYERLMAAS